MNPVLPKTFFMADAEAHVMPDGRLYMIGSTDISGSKDYCSRKYHIWSTSDSKLNDWIDHGVIFDNGGDNPGIPWSPGTTLYAPDMAYKDGKYYIYICGADSLEAIASADSPAGPYGDAHRINIADRDGIDPTVFVDDDGQAYYLWGQFHLRGGKLKDNMYELCPETVVDNILTEQQHGFHEGASMRKINGRYYIVYTDISRGKATCMSYAVSDSPLGPYKKGGVIVDNIYCDPQTWNNHGSIQCYKDQWYVFYHRSSQCSNTSRRVCAEPITILPDGSISEVCMTSSGADIKTDAFAEIDASVACRMMGGLHITPDEEIYGREILKDCGGGSWAEAWAEYRYLDFKDGADFFAATVKGKGLITVMTDKDGKIATLDFDSDKRMKVKADLLSKPCGVQAVWLLFSGGFDLVSFEFYR